VEEDSHCIRRGSTGESDPIKAAEALYGALFQPDLELVILFCSADYDLGALGPELSRLFGEAVPVVGCTTAGEIGETGYLSGCISGVSLAAPDFHASTEVIADLASFTVMEAHQVVRNAMRRLEGKIPDLKRDQLFAMLMIDGLSICEETVVSALHGVLGEIPLFGGSSADAFQFSCTPILHGGHFRSDIGVLMVISSAFPFHVFKTEHFAGAGEKIVVTEADPARRVVSEINAEPAALEYARLVGLTLEELTPMVFASYPMVVRVGGMNFVRSVQKANPDLSLTFYCAIDEGIVLTLARAHDIEQDLHHLFQGLDETLGPPQLIIGCECALRRLELEQRQMKPRVGSLMARNNVVGFATFGEQFQAMHVNQTFTGVAIGRRRVRP